MCSIFTAIFLGITMITIGGGLMEFSEAGKYDWVVSESPEATNDDALTLAKTATDLPALVQRSVIADSFSTFDVNSNGGLELDEFKVAAASVATPWGVALPEDGLQAIFDAADVDGSGMMEVTEFPLNASRSSPTGPPISFVYSWGDDSDKEIFTAEALQEMCQIESWVTTHKNYKQICVIDAAGDCVSSPFSIVTHFYGFGHDDSCPLLPEATVTSTREQIYEMLNTEAGFLAYGYFMERHYKAKGNMTALTRSTIILGAPLEGYATARDRDNQQMERYKELLGDVEKLMFDKFGMKQTLFKSHYALDVVNRHVKSPSGKLKLKFYSFIFQQMEFDRLVNGDLLMAVLSVTFVFIWIWTHSESLFLASTGMGMILMSLPNALFIYKCIFMVPYFVQIHILAIFLVLGEWAPSAKCRS
jgi:hypothetical protein